jgi:hypothetical protein
MILMIVVPDWFDVKRRPSLCFRFRGDDDKALWMSGESFGFKEVVILLCSVEGDMFEMAKGSTVVIEGIPGMRSTELRIGKRRRMTVAVKIIPLRKGAAFWLDSLTRIHVRSKMMNELKARVRILSAMIGL